MSDFISRADAIDAVANVFAVTPTEMDVRSNCVDALSALPSAEAVSRTSKGICAVCERKQVCEDGNRNVDMIGCSRFELDTHYNLSAETSQNLAKPRKELKGSDLISRDVVLANINERLRANGYGNVGLVSELNRLIGYVRNIPSAEAVQGWIPFTRRPMTEEEQKDYPNCTFMFDCVLPDDGDEILVSNGRFVWMDIFCNDIDGCYLDSGDDIDEDMAWMPLPKPYEGGGSE